MSLKKWLAAFATSALFVCLLFAGFNALVDPFGIFGDRLLEFWSYDMTQNPRTAKISWIDKHHGDYDSYIIGCSKTSSYPAELLNGYFGASFYNMTMYGGDLYDCEATLRYILENYGARHIIINTGLEELHRYNEESDPIKDNLHAKVDGSSKLLFYGKYLFAHPRYALDKLAACRDDTYLVNPTKVFIPETGVYDKSKRDVEPIGAIEDYLALYPEFQYARDPHPDLPCVENCLDCVARIKRMCDEAGATLTYIISPMYDTELDSYQCDDLFRFLERLSEITDYWDFSGYHAIAGEPRYFYDPLHFRNNIGELALARMFDDPARPVPEGFGALVTADNVKERIANYDGRERPVTGFDAKLPALMYHNVNPSPKTDYEVSVETFGAQLAALKGEGYNTVTLRQLVEYATVGAPLPENPILITFDDGYADVLTYAAPILQSLGMSAVINVIGVSDGKDTYKDTGFPIVPHFSLDEALTWVGNGVIEIGSHSYDMHNVPELDGENCRQGVLTLDGETESAYIENFRDDFAKSSAAIAEALGAPVAAYAYPFGLNSTLSEVLLSEMGIEATMTSDPGVNTIVKNLPQSLRLLKRFNIDESITADGIVGYIGG